MITDYEILETMKMFKEQHLDIRTITMGISLMDCAASSVDECCDKIYDKILPIVMKHEDISRIQSFRVSFRRKKISFALVYKYDAKDPEADMEALKKEIQKLYPEMEIEIFEAINI